jgi:hypothetical protein
MRVRLPAALAALLCAALAMPAPSFAWGGNADRLITNKAVDSLPAEMRPFFEANRQYFVLHASDPLELLAKNPNERHNQFIRLDHYGQFPFTTLPRDYKFAVGKFGKHNLETYGLLPWQVGVYSERLTNAFRTRNWDEVRLSAALLAFYVAAAHDPFNTTTNEDGKLSAQLGVNQRFGSSLVDRFSLFFFVRPNEAAFINDPTDHAFEMCLSAHSWLENILIADRRSRLGLHDYTDDFYDRFYSQAGAVLIRQISDAATDVGSYWMTAWVNAGKPQLPPR